MAKKDIKLVEGKKERQILGLKDHGTIRVCCSNCETALMDFLITKTNDELVAEGHSALIKRVVIKCDICGGDSSVRTICGDFYTGVAADNIGFEPLDEKIHDVDHVFRAWKK